MHGVDRVRFFEYMRGHWREIADDIESLPKAEGNFYSDADASNASVNHFGAACEWLDPLEYLDFMDKFLELFEHKRIGFMPLQMQITADCKKQDFLEVNWEHPRVKAIFEKVRKLTPSSETAFLSYVDSAAKGELADNYKTNMADDAPLPETLPGIKLQPPWISLIKKYEEVTGKRVHSDPAWEAPPSRRERTHADLVKIETGSHRRSRAVWPWLAAVATFIATLSLVWKSRRKARHAP